MNNGAQLRVLYLRPMVKGHRKGILLVSDTITVYIYLTSGFKAVQYSKTVIRGVITCLERV